VQDWLDYVHSGLTTVDDLYLALPKVPHKLSQLAVPFTDRVLPEELLDDKVEDLVYIGCLPSARALIKE
jgi:hypothetical protein